jgi:DNA-binding XRE family transcriptional regulator
MAGHCLPRAGEFRKGWTQEKVAKTVGVAQPRVSQIEKEAATIIRTDNSSTPDLRRSSLEGA